MDPRGGVYSHTVPGMQKAAAKRLDVLLPNIEEIENVGKMSAEYFLY